MSYTKRAYLDLSEALGLSPAQLLNVPTKAEILAKWQREVAEELTEVGVEVAEEELTVAEARIQRSAERAGEEALNYWGR